MEGEWGDEGGGREQGIDLLRGYKLKMCWSEWGMTCLPPPPPFLHPSLSYFLHPSFLPPPPSSSSFLPPPPSFLPPFLLLLPSSSSFLPPPSSLPQLSILNTTVDYLRKYLPNKVVYPAVGNHEISPVNRCLSNGFIYTLLTIILPLPLIQLPSSIHYWKPVQPMAVGVLGSQMMPRRPSDGMTTHDHT